MKVQTIYRNTHIQVLLTFSEAPRTLGVMLLADVERGTNPRGF
jgi:hypothetical protein